MVLSSDDLEIQLALENAKLRNCKLKLRVPCWDITCLADLIVKESQPFLVMESIAS